MASTQTQYGMLNAMPNILDKPLYTDAVYGTKKIKDMTEAVIFSALLL